MPTSRRGFRWHRALYVVLRDEQVLARRRTFAAALTQAERLDGRMIVKYGPDDRRAPARRWYGRELEQLLATMRRRGTRYSW